MEDDTRVFFIKILQTISIVLLWMMANIFVGFYKDYAFFVHRPNWTNYLYYTLAAISFVILIIHLKRKWRL